MNIAPIRHVIWDWNGTLFDDAWLCVDVMNGVLQRRGRAPLTLARYRDIFDFPVERYYRRLDFDWSRETFEEVGAEFMRDYERRRLECGLRAGAQAAVGYWRAHGAEQSVISGYRHDTLEELLRHYGLRDAFAWVVGSDDIYARGKLEQGRRWRELSGCGDGEGLVVGDTVHDYELSREIGAHCVLLDGGNQSPERLAACGVPVYPELENLLADWRRWAKKDVN